MEVHYTKHHQAYCDKTNAALKGTEWEDKPIEDVLQHLSKLPEDIRETVRNNGGGYYNHNLFWTMMAQNPTEPSGELKPALEEAFGSVQDFTTLFSEAATTQFGSGWAWLTSDNGTLRIEKTPNQDSPVSEGRVPLLLLDVWEHAYYLSYQNRRPDYIAAWWHVVNWEEVERRFVEAQK
jgi:Fe-Mn family superoxide dismutase